MNWWQTPLVSAGTALIVTLLVEYMAKPWLEARKDRILSEVKALRELRVFLGKIEATAIKLSGVTSGEETVAKWILELDSELTKNIDSAFERYALLGAKLPSDVEPLCREVIGEISSVQVRMSFAVNVLQSYGNTDDFRESVKEFIQDNAARMIEMGIVLKLLVGLRNRRINRPKRKVALKVYKERISKDTSNLKSFRESSAQVQESSS